MDDVRSIELAGPGQGREEPVREPGQVLKSMDASLTVLAEQLRQSEVASLVKLVELLQANEEDLVTYLTSDSKGKLIPRFLAQLATQLTREHVLLRREYEQLARDTEQLRKLLGLEPGPEAKRRNGNGGSAGKGGLAAPAALAARS